MKRRTIKKQDARLFREHDRFLKFHKGLHTRWSTAGFIANGGYLHPCGRCTCGHEGTCDWCRIPCAHGFGRFEFCEACADEADAAYAEAKAMNHGAWADEVDL